MYPQIIDCKLTALDMPPLDPRADRWPPLTGPDIPPRSRDNNPYIGGDPENPNTQRGIPFRAQHYFYKAVQRILEEVCFHFANRHCPEVLRARGWEVPESGEFNAWWSALSPHMIPADFVNVIPGLDIRCLFKRLNHGESTFLFMLCFLACRKLYLIKWALVRHSAVHQRETHMAGLKHMSEDAVTLAILLRDNLRRNKLRSIEIELHGGDVDKLRKTLDRSLDEFSNFEFPGRLPDPPSQSQTNYRSRSHEPVQRIISRSQYTRSRVPKTKTVSLPAGTLFIDLTTTLGDGKSEDHQAKEIVKDSITGKTKKKYVDHELRERIKDVVVDLISDSENEEQRPNAENVRPRHDMPAAKWGTAINQQAKAV
jgi:hypothetical protein